MRFDRRWVFALATSFANKFVEWFGHSGVVENEASEITRHAQKSAQIADVLGNRNSLNSLRFSGVGSETFVVHQESKIHQLLLCEHAFLEVERHAGFSKGREHHVEVANVVFPCFAEHDDIVEKHHTALPAEAC